MISDSLQRGPASLPTRATRGRRRERQGIVEVMSATALAPEGWLR